MTFLVVLSVILLLSSTLSLAARAKNKQCGISVPSTVTSRPSKIIIAHRGASFHLPEHTLPAYRLALELGTDYIEPDLVVTKDKKLIAFHDMDLNASTVDGRPATNVAEVFPDRYSFSEFSNRTGYWVYDFNLADIKKLYVLQRLPGARSTEFDTFFGIPTLLEVLELLDDWNTDILPKLSARKRRAGLYAEIKDPKWFAAETDINPVDLLMQEISASPHASAVINDTDCMALKFDEYLIPPLVVQCFEGQTLQELSTKWTDTFPDSTLPPMVLLGDRESCLEEEWWFHIGEWSHFLKGVGPDKACLFDAESTSFMERAKEHELVVHPWTERPELQYLESEDYPDVLEELTYLLCRLGVDGVFSEDVARAAIAVRQDCGDHSPATASPTSSNTGDEANCPDQEGLSEDSAYLGVAAGIMGVLVGCVSTIFVITSRYCKSQRHTRRQLRIPTHDDLEMI
jgi:glycerophosphoryl diester phosphodiesterase